MSLLFGKEHIFNLFFLQKKKSFQAAAQSVFQDGNSLAIALFCERQEEDEEKALDNGDTSRSFHLNRGEKYVLRLSKVVEKKLKRNY